VKYSLGINKEDNFPKIFEDDWPDFVSILGEMSEEIISGNTKDECKNKALGVTACTFGNDGRRLKANATSADFVWLDCEDGEPNELLKAVEGLQDLNLEAVVYTSAGHAPPADRFRIIVPVGTPIADHGKYRRVCLRLQAALGVNVDMGKLTMYALLFQPAKYSSAAENLFLHLPGTILSSEEWLSICPPPPPPPPMPTIPLTAENLPSGYVEAAVKGEIARIEAAIPSRRHDTILCAAIRLAELAKAGVLDWATAMAVIREHGIGKIGWGRKDEVEDILRYAWQTATPRKMKEQIGNIDRLRMKAIKKRKDLSYE
jgi:hypothetical protein